MFLFQVEGAEGRPGSAQELARRDLEEEFNVQRARMKELFLQKEGSSKVPSWCRSWEHDVDVNSVGYVACPFANSMFVGRHLTWIVCVRGLLGSELDFRPTLLLIASHTLTFHLLIEFYNNDIAQIEMLMYHAQNYNKIM